MNEEEGNKVIGSIDGTPYFPTETELDNIDNQSLRMYSEGYGDSENDDGNYKTNKDDEMGQYDDMLTRLSIGRSEALDKTSVYELSLTKKIETNDEDESCEDEIDPFER